MTIAQRFVELGEELGLDTSKYNTGNVTEVINAMTQDLGGEVSNNGVISTAMMNFTKALKENSTEGSGSDIVTEPDMNEEL